MSDEATHERDSTPKDDGGVPEQSTQNGEDQRRGAEPARAMDPDPADEAPGDDHG